MLCRAVVMLMLLVGVSACDMQADDAKVKPAEGFRAEVSAPYALKRDEGEILYDRRGRTNIIKVSPRTGSESFAMGTQDMPPGTGILVHKHDRTEEILYVNEGSGTLLLGDERIQVEADTTVWIPPGTWHGIENPKGHMHVLWFVAPPGLDGFFRGIGWPPGEKPKALSPDEIDQIGKQHDSVTRPSLED